MRMCEILNEKAFRVDVRNGTDEVTTIVHANPRPTQLANFLSRSKWKNVRGLIDDSTIYWWDAADSTHEQMGNVLGLDPPCRDEDDPRRLLLSLNKDGTIYLAASDHHGAHSELEKLSRLGNVVTA